MVKGGARMLDFETSAGNIYAWDDDTGFIIPFSATMKAVMHEAFGQEKMSKDDVIKKLKENYSEDQIAFCYDWINKWDMIRPKDHKCLFNQDISATSIKRFLLRDGLSQLILGVTEKCNFRCNYCVYSDNYEHARMHSDISMSSAIARRCIDYYITLFKEGKRYNPLRKPAIGFYGGEPLLNFDLIEDCVDYITNNYKEHNIRYYITTNGSLLDRKRADWLMEHDFGISISLDGPEEEHNRNRVYINGKGTFNRVMKNVSKIMEEGYKNIDSMPVFDWKSDLFKLDEFFNREDVPPVSRVAPVSRNAGSKYYQQFTREDYDSFQKQIRCARDHYFRNISAQREAERPSFFHRLFGDSMEGTFLGIKSLYHPHPMMPVTNSCILGTKLFIDVNGYFHACEKINYDYSFGNVDDGVNFERIRKIMSDYISHMDKCSSCKASRRCSNCYLMFMNTGGFSLSSEVCKEMENEVRAELSGLITIAEKNQWVVDGADPNSKNIRKYYGD